MTNKTGGEPPLRNADSGLDDTEVAEVPSEVLPRRPSPAEGEGRAARSLRYQFEIVATRVYDALREDSLDRLWLGDPNVGAVDDAVLRVAGSIIAYSAKYDDAAAPLSFTNLISADERGRTLIGDLYLGYQAVKARHSDSGVTVVLVTNRPASASDRKAGISMRRLIKEFFEPLSLDSAADLPKQCKTAVDLLKTSLNISEEDLRSFLRNVRFELESEPANYQDGSRTRKDDVQKLFDELWRRRSEQKARLVTLTPTEILYALGWQGRPGFANFQRFPIEPSEYEPLMGALDALEQLISTHEYGYVVLLGGPGSGKSTLLQGLIDRRPDDIIIRYFAYVKDDAPFWPREEAKSFLHDVCKQLRDARVMTSDSLIPNDLDQLRLEFSRGLESAETYYSKTSRRVIVIVDGLDHVGRRANVTQRLTHVLPHPSVVPQGVLFVLGSQHLDDVDAAIRLSLDASRRLKMDEYSLSAEQISAILLRNVAGITPQAISTVVSISQGNPLAFTIALQALRGVEPTDVESALARLPAYAGSATLYFETLLSDVLAQPLLRRTFAVLARLRRPLQQDWLTSWPEEGYEFLKDHWFLFRRDNKFWTFAHDSIRHFLIRRTAEINGEYSIADDQSYHRRCAELCAVSPVDLYQWEELYHRFASGNDEAVNRLATQRAFREQYIGHRNASHIREDIELALNVAARHKDGVALWRLTLALAELTQREFNLEPLESWLALIDVGDIAKALVSSGARELSALSGKSRLQLSKKFYGAGLHDLARMLYRGVDPRQLSGQYGRVFDEGIDLDDWSFLTLKFDGKEMLRSALPRLIAQGDSLRPPDRLSWGEGDEREGRSELVRYHVALGAIAADAIDVAHEQWKVFLDKEHSHSLTTFLRLSFRLARKCSAAERLDIAERILARPDLAAAPSSFFLALASLLESLGKRKEAVAFLEASQHNAGLIDPFEQPDRHFEKELLCVRLDLPLEPIVAVPISDRESPDNYLDFVFHESIRKLVLLKCGNSEKSILDVTRFISERCVLPTQYDPHRFRTYRLNRLLRFSIRRLTDCAGADGFDTLAKLHELWFTSGAASEWSMSDKRLAIQLLAEAGLRNSDIITTARKHDQSYDYGDPSGRVAAAQERLRMWLALDQPDPARVAIRDMMFFSFGVGSRKDYQLDSFVLPLRQLYAVDETRYVGDLEWLTAKAIGLCDVIEERAPRRFLREALKLLAERDELKAAAWASVSGRWLDAVPSIARAMVARGKAREAATYLLYVIVPLMSTAKHDLAEDVFANASDAYALAERYATHVNAIAPRPVRRAWYAAAAWGFLKAGIEVPSALRDVSRLPPSDEPKDDFIPPATLRDLLERRNNVPRWQTTRLLELLPRSHEEEALLSAWATEEQDLEIVGRIGVRALNNGCRGLAESVWSRLRNAQQDRSMGWVRYLDGGYQVSFFELGIRLGFAKPEDAFADFAAYVRELASPVLALGALPEIERICATTWDAAFVWNECHEYLDSLLNPIPSATIKPEQVPTSLFEWVIEGRLDSPVFTMRDAIRRFAAQAMIENHDGVSSWIERASSSGRSDVAVIVSVALAIAPSVYFERDVLLARFAAGDARARQAIDELGWGDVAADIKPVDAPLILLNDPILRLRSLAGDVGMALIRRLSEILGVPIEDVASCALQALQQSAVVGKASSEYLTDADVLVNARLALRETVRRMCKPGNLGVSIDRGLRCFDPRVIAFGYRPRPPSVYSVEMPHHDDFPHASVAIQTMESKLEEWVCIAEVAFWHFRNRQYTEDRLNVRRGLAVSEDDDPFETLEKRGVASTLDYPGHPLVANDSLDMDDWMCANWVALKPQAARSIGWTPCSAGLFSYASGTGDVVAETVLWRDAQYGTSERRSHGPKGIGAAVIVRRDHLQELRKLHPQIGILTTITVRRDSGEFENARHLFPLP